MLIVFVMLSVVIDITENKILVYTMHWNIIIIIMHTYLITITIGVLN